MREARQLWKPNRPASRKSHPAGCIFSRPRHILKPMENVWRKNRFIQNFFKCGTAGWCLEILFTAAESILTHDWRLMGKTSLLMFPIYGLGALLWPVGRLIDRWLEEGIPQLERASLSDRVLRHGMIDMVLIFCAEYFFGSWLQRAGICPWDYTGRPTNVNGLIRLDFAPLWFLTGLLFERISWKGNGKMLEKL